MNLNVIPRLNEILKERKITQAQLSEMTGINQSTISRFDKNKQHMAIHLVLISRALDMSIEELFVIDHELPRDNGRQVGSQGAERDTNNRTV